MKFKIFPVVLLFFVSAINGQTINWLKDFKRSEPDCGRNGQTDDAGLYGELV